VTGHYSGKKIEIGPELYKKGCVASIEEGLVSAEKIGYPIMIKASEGGGGKGIRKVENADEFPNAYKQVFQNHYIRLYTFYFRNNTVFEIINLSTLRFKLKFLDLQYS